MIPASKHSRLLNYKSLELLSQELERKLVLFLQLQVVAVLMWLLINATSFWEKILPFSTSLQMLPCKLHVILQNTAAGHAEHSLASAGSASVPRSIWTAGAAFPRSQGVTCSAVGPPAQVFPVPAAALHQPKSFSLRRCILAHHCELWGSECTGKT